MISSQPHPSSSKQRTRLLRSADALLFLARARNNFSCARARKHVNTVTEKHVECSMIVSMPIHSYLKSSASHLSAIVNPLLHQFPSEPRTEKETGTDGMGGRMDKPYLATYLAINKVFSSTQRVTYIVKHFLSV